MNKPARTCSVMELAPAAPKPKPAIGFSTAAISNVSGATERQLQLWDERGIVKPRQSKHRRVYSLSEAVTCLIVHRLRQSKYSLKRIQQLTAGLEAGSRFQHAIDQDSELFLLVGWIGRASSRFAVSESMAVREMILHNEPFSIVAVHELARSLKDCADPMAKGERR